MTAHRYWRIRMTAAAGNAFGFSEIQFRTTPGVSLPFSGGVASAADTYGGAPGTYDASKATDGNTATLYGSNNTTPPQWWEYDYGVGNSLDLAEIMITARADSFYTQAPTDFVPEYSDDGTTWHGCFPIHAPLVWATATQTQTFAVTQLAATTTFMTQIALEQWASGADGRMTQIAVEQWNVNLPIMLMTQVALEQWATVAGAGFFSARHV